MLLFLLGCDEQVGFVGQLTEHGYAMNQQQLFMVLRRVNQIETSLILKLMYGCLPCSWAQMATPPAKLYLTMHGDFSDTRFDKSILKQAVKAYDDIPSALVMAVACSHADHHSAFLLATEAHEVALTWLRKGESKYSDCYCMHLIHITCCPIVYKFGLLHVT